MPRSKKKPDYDPQQIMQDYMDTLVEAFGSYDDREDQAGKQSNRSLNTVAAEFDITALKARKLLITAGVYSTQISRTVQEMSRSGAQIEQIMSVTGLSRASVHSYLPYKKILYNLKELSTNAERIKVFRERKRRCQEFYTGMPRMSLEMQHAELWKLMILLQGCVFHTTKGLKFSYKIRGGEMFVNRKSKSITQATVFMAYTRGMELMERDGTVTGPKKLGTFGASYLYPVFERIGVITQIVML